MRNKKILFIETLVFFVAYTLLVTQYKTEEESKIVLFLQLGTAVISATALLVLSRFKSLTKPKIDNIVVLLFVFIVFVSSCLISSGSFQQTILSMLFAILAYILVLSINRGSLVLVLSWYISINAILIFIQIFTYSIFGYYIEMHSVLFPFSIEAEYTYWHGNARFSGIHAEPGSFSNAIGISTILYLISSKNRSQIVILLAILSILVTRSLSGAFYILLMLCLLINKRSMMKLSLLALPIAFCALAFGSILIAKSDTYKYYSERVTGTQSYTDNSVSVKLINFNDVYSRDLATLLKGYGLGNNECNYCFAIRGNGSLFYALFFMGLSGIILFLPLVAKLRSRYVLILFFCLITTRFTFLNPFFWFVYMFIYNCGGFYESNRYRS